MPLSYLPPPSPGAAHPRNPCKRKIAPHISFKLWCFPIEAMPSSLCYVHPGKNILSGYPGFASHNFIDIIRSPLSLRHSRKNNLSVPPLLIDNNHKSRQQSVKPLVASVAFDIWRFLNTLICFRISTYLSQNPLFSMPFSLVITNELFILDLAYVAWRHNLIIPLVPKGSHFFSWLFSCSWGSCRKSWDFT